MKRKNIFLSVKKSIYVCKKARPNFVLLYMQVGVYIVHICMLLIVIACKINMLTTVLSQTGIELNNFISNPKNIQEMRKILVLFIKI